MPDQPPVDDVLKHLRAAQRSARSALKLAREMNEAHGVESWAELDWSALAEFDPVDLATDSVAEVRAVIDELDELMRS